VILGPENGTIEVRTYREGLAQKAGHDLIIDVAGWKATVGDPENDPPSSIGLEVDPRSLQIREGRHGVKPLSDGDRREIRKTIDEKVLRGQPIVFRSTTVDRGRKELAVRGELTLAGITRPASFELELSADRRLTGTLNVTQSEWGIKPYRGLMGALKVRDSVEIVLDVQLPS
jgi:polyisoprenoid-binding protein YceI